ncbi:MAG: MarR family transcriptional regulator [Crocinitomicaceae bacterium]|nr:MarR family transcriptional regulator [Crocinitomicaceae bacterium]
MQDDMLKLENQICFPLYAASRLVTKLYQPILSKWDITYPQYLVFLLLWEKDKRTVSDICNCLFLESSTLTPLLKRLETKDYIVRTRSLQDERSVIIQLTPKGKALRKEAKKIPQEILQSVSSKTIKKRDLVQLKSTLSEITKVIQ